MKKRLIIMSLLILGTASSLLLGTGCGKDANSLPEPKVQNSFANRGGGEEEEEEMSHLAQILINPKNSSNQQVLHDFTMYHAGTSAFWSRGLHAASIVFYDLGQVSGSSVDYAYGIDNSGNETSTLFENNQYYYLIPDGSYPKQIIYFKWNYVTGEAPTMVFNYNTSTKQFSLYSSSSSSGVTYSINTFNESPL